MNGDSWWSQFVGLTRFGGVGGLCALLNFVILYVGTSLLHAHYLVSAIVSFALLTPLSYLLHKAFSFRDRQPAAGGQFALYLINLVLSVAANLGLMIVFVELARMNYLVSAFLATTVIFTGSYAANAFWVFRARQ